MYRQVYIYSVISTQGCDEDEVRRTRCSARDFMCANQQKYNEFAQWMIGLIVLWIEVVDAAYEFLALDVLKQNKITEQGIVRGRDRKRSQIRAWEP